MRWSSRSLGSKFQYEIFYFIIRHFGRWSAYCILFFVICRFTLSTSVRNRSKPYLTRRFPGARGPVLLLHTWKLQWTFGQCLVDRAAAGIRNDFSFAANARHILDAALAREHGIILLAAHTGCWQTAHHALLEYVGLPVTVLGHHDEQDIDKDIAEHRGENPSHAFVGRDDGHLGPVKLVALLRRGEILCTTGDRIIENDKSVLTADFLGGKIRISCLPFRLASATGAPVVVAFARRAGPGRGEMDFVKAVNVPEGLGGASEKYRPYVGDYVSELEKFVLNHPYQFFNFYNLWE